VTDPLSNSTISTNGKVWIAYIVISHDFTDFPSDKFTDIWTYYNIAYIEWPDYVVTRHSSDHGRVIQ